MTSDCGNSLDLEGAQALTSAHIQDEKKLLNLLIHLATLMTQLLQKQSSGRTHDTLEECVVERCEDPQKHESTMKSECRRKIEQVNSVFCFGSESSSWIRAILAKDVRQSL